MLGYVIIVYGFLSDVIIFKEDLDPLQVAGAMIIFAATFFVSTYKLCEAHKKRKKAALEIELAEKGESSHGADEIDKLKKIAFTRQVTVGM